MKLVVGLGNPGKDYEETRHNLGFAVVDRLAGRWEISVRKSKFQARLGQGAIAGIQTLLIKPMMYMNRSGQSVLGAVQFHKVDWSRDLLVISDDLDLPIGKLRMRARGSAGGHKGLGDIQNRLGSSDFARLRIGIDNPGQDTVEHVLTRFRAEEKERVAGVVERAADAVECWLRAGVAAAMNEFNRPDGSDRADDKPQEPH